MADCDFCVMKANDNCTIKKLGFFFKLLGSSFSLAVCVNNVMLHPSTRWRQTDHCRHLLFTSTVSEAYFCIIEPFVIYFLAQPNTIYGHSKTHWVLHYEELDKLPMWSILNEIKNGNNINCNCFEYGGMDLVGIIVASEQEGPMFDPVRSSYH